MEITYFGDVCNDSPETNISEILGFQFCETDSQECISLGMGSYPKSFNALLACYRVHSMFLRVQYMPAVRCTGTCASCIDITEIMDIMERNLLRSYATKTVLYKKYCICDIISICSR